MDITTYFKKWFLSNQGRIEKLVAERGYKLLKYSYAGALRGPKCWPRNEGLWGNSQVFRITVENEKGEAKKGWLYFEYSFVVVISQPDFIWDEEDPELLTDNILMTRFRVFSVLIPMLILFIWSIAILLLHVYEIPLINIYWAMLACIFFILLSYSQKIYLEKNLTI